MDSILEAISPTEKDRLRDGMRVAARRYTTHDWRFYFSYLLGRSVTLAETDRFLRETATLQEGMPA